MLSLWPTLFDYQFFAPTILRLGLGLALLWNGYQRQILAKQNLTTPNKRWAWFVGLEWFLAVLIILGLFSQLVAAAVALWSGSQIKKQPTFGLLALTIALALLLLGPGALSLDLPL